MTAEQRSPATPASDVVATTLRGMWLSLPALTVASFAICLAAAVPAVLAPGLNPLAAIIAALVVSPFVAGLVAAVNRIADGEQTTIRQLVDDVRRLSGFAVVTALIPAIAIALFLVAIVVLRATGALWVWPSFALTGAVSVIAAVACAAALPLGAARSDLRGRRLWLLAVALVASHPARFVAVVTTLVLGVWSATALTASLLLLVPVPVAIVAVTATWSSWPSLDLQRN